MEFKKLFLGEFIGTMLLVTIGCSAVASAVIMNWLSALWQVALVFGLGVTIAIYASKKLSNAHLNPAVTLAMMVTKKNNFKEATPYILGQFLGGLMGGLIVFFLFQQNIQEFEEINGILRGQNNSTNSAMIFGEFFPNPGYSNLRVSHITACLAEGLGTLFLICIIFLLTGSSQLNQKFTPLLIGLTVTFLICVIAPYTQAGFNPARDFSPRIIAYFMGWKNAAFPSIPGSFFTVYILSPIIGGIVSGLIYNILFKKN